MGLGTYSAFFGFAVLDFFRETILRLGLQVITATIVHNGICEM